MSMAELRPSAGGPTAPHSELSQTKTTGQRPLSCTNCRQRKMKCNRLHPCTPCQRSGYECVFPERAKRQKKGPHKAKVSTNELLNRLHRMESLLGAVKNEGKPVPEEPKQMSTPPWMSPGRTDTEDGSQDNALSEREKEGSGSPSDGLNRYIGGGFWRTLTSEVEGLRQAIDEEEDAEYGDSPYSGSGEGLVPNTSTIFGSAFNTPQTLRPLHPPPAQISLLTEIFITNVDPMCKFMHIPSLRALIASVTADVDRIQMGDYLEAMLFAIYYAAITSLSNELCIYSFQQGRDVLLSKYRAGFERALTNADFLNTTELGVLQALCIFLLAVRSNDATKYSWTMIAILVRLGYSLGLHRESLSMGMSPFTSEMRRRLWWHLIVLDIRCCEDRATEPLISPNNFNTQKPLNVNDDDLKPDMKALPPEREGFTEMSKSWVHHEVSYLRWRFGEVPHFNFEKDPGVATSERINLVGDLEKSLNDRVIRYCDPSNAVAWVTSVVSRLIMCRIRLMLYHPIETTKVFPRAERPYISNEKLLETAVACMEYSHLLDAEPKAAQWRWFFKTYVQWHALATALAELCLQTKGPLVDRAWRIVDTVFDDWAARIADSPNGMLWRPIKKLMTKAQAKRLQAQQSEQTAKIDAKPQQPLPEFASLAFEPSVAQPTATSTAKPLTQLQSVKQYGVPCMAPFDGTEAGIAGNTANAAKLTGSLHASSSTSYLSDASFTEATDAQPNTSGQQYLPYYDLPNTNEADNTGSINWAEWDEFMSGFDWEGNAGKDVDMMGVGTSKGDESVGVWW